MFIYDWSQQGHRTSKKINVTYVFYGISTILRVLGFKIVGNTLETKTTMASTFDQQSCDKIKVSHGANLASVEAALTQVCRRKGIHDDRSCHKMDENRRISVYDLAKLDQ